MHKIIINGKATLATDLEDAMSLARRASKEVASAVFVQYKSMVDGRYYTQARFVDGRMI